MAKSQVGSKSSKFLKTLSLALLGCGFVWWSHLSFPQEKPQEKQLLQIDAVFELMANQIVDVACNAPEFKACFDVPYTECSRELRTMLNECRLSREESLPELIAAEDMDPIIEETYQCVIPKWDDLIKDRRTETKECADLERKAAEGRP